MNALAHFIYAPRTKDEEQVLAVKLFCVLAATMALLIASGLL